MDHGFNARGIALEIHVCSRLNPKSNANVIAKPMLEVYTGLVRELIPSRSVVTSEPVVNKSIECKHPCRIY